MCISEYNTKPLVSIIIPVYNCEKYVERCVQSVVQQTYRNLEIIMIDDGSRDKSGLICDSYAEKDHRIKVIHQKNAGPGQARNTGLSHVTGTYLVYIDSDDYVSSRYIQRMIDLVKQYQADIVEVGSVWMLPLKNEIHSADEAIQCFEGKQELINDYFSANRKLQNTLWGRLFLWEKIQDIRFSEKSIAEDSEYSLKAFANCRKLVKSNDVLYAYRAYPESITRRRISNKHFDVVDVCVRDMLYCEKNNVTIENWQYVVDQFINMCIGLLSKTAEEKCEFDFDDEVRNMEKALLVVKQVAERHNVVVNNCLETILPNLSSWAKGFRKKNSIKLKIGKLKRSISGIVAKSKVKTSYEYQLDKE